MVLSTGLQMRLKGKGKVTLMRQEGNIQRTMNRKETYLETCKLVQNLGKLFEYPFSYFMSDTKDEKD